MFNKKGVSPLIATILLVACTVAMAFIVIVWATDFFDKFLKDNKEETLKTESALVCNTDLKFEVRHFKCPNKILFENKGNIDIEKLVLRFFYDKDINQDPQIIDGLKKYELKTFTIQNVDKYTNTIEVLAIIKLDGKNITCGNNRAIKPVDC